VDGGEGVMVVCLHVLIRSEVFD